MEYHVSKKGNDKNCGSLELPFYTISKAALVAEEGDRVVVHEGTYRECVSPENGARTAAKSIVYEAAKGEKVIIKGSEQIKTWKKYENSIWKAELDNAFFGEFNPYSEVIDGDWLMKPLDNMLHLGQVYINGKALSEVTAQEALAENMTWYAEVTDDTTVIYANFGSNDPNVELTEINVRRSCFYPEKTGINYITVRGFEMAHAACPWAPPTADQPGMIGAHWSKGWVVENNILHDARCSAISIGKEISTGHNLYNRYHRKPGYQTQLETVFNALRAGWSKEKIGSHIIRNNTIYDCGQNGIVGNMGGAFSEIYGNHIYNIGNKHEFFGYEIAGIKLHAAIDTYIHDNNIHDCWMGTWLDWEAQGVRLSSNLYYNNERDFWIEVTHGPHTVDNNVFGSASSFSNAAQGGAYIHNLFCGGMHRYDVRDRSTPYHLNHSTEIMGTAVVYGGDDRFYQNIFIGKPEEKLWDKRHPWLFGTSAYNGYAVSMEEYIDRVMENGKGDIERYYNVMQPVYINQNSYLSGAKPFDREETNFVSDFDPNDRIYEENGCVYLEIDIPEGMFLENTEPITTEKLGVPRISEAPFENADGTPLEIDHDYGGSERSAAPKIGPFEGLKTGHNKILLWKK